MSGLVEIVASLESLVAREKWMERFCRFGINTDLTCKVLDLSWLQENKRAILRGLWYLRCGLIVCGLGEWTALVKY